DKLLKWSFGLCQGLWCLHENDIIHGDVKGSNVLLYKDDNVKLTDFNVSIKLWHPHETRTDRVGTMTHTCLEMLKKVEWSKPVDIWSLGCTLYEIAFGKLLFVSQNYGQKKEDKERDFKILL